MATAVSGGAMPLPRRRASQDVHAFALSTERLKTTNPKPVGMDLLRGVRWDARRFRPEGLSH